MDGVMRSHWGNKVTKMNDCDFREACKRMLSDVSLVPQLFCTGDEFRDLYDEAKRRKLWSGPPLEVDLSLPERLTD